MRTDCPRPGKCTTLCKKALRSLRQEGCIATLRKTCCFLHAWFLLHFHFRALPVQRFIEQTNTQHKKVIIIGPTIEWDYIMFQRPQQLALAFARQGCLVIYLENIMRYSDYRRIQENLYVLAAYDFTRLLESLRDVTILFPQGIYWDGREHELLALAQTNTLIFEYLDHIDEQISGTQGAAALRRLLAFLIAHADQVRFSATARSLVAELEGRGAKNILLAPNGVDTHHFKRQRELPDDPQFRKIVAGDRPIIGYYGALAPWLDYPLLNAVTRQCPDFEFVYIGVDYQHAAHQLDQSLHNCTWLGPRDYAVLPHYASFFDAAIIPFQAGAIARATSPIKLFEYFSLGIPVVVTSDMTECTRYSEVLSANGEREFIACLKKALHLNVNTHFINKLHSLATDNTWDARARCILDFAS